MPSKSISKRKCLAALAGLFCATSAQAFDVGFERNNSSQAVSFKLETIIERYYRTMQVPTKAIARSWGITDGSAQADIDRLTANPYLTGELHAYNLVIRPTINIKNTVSAFIDLAIFDDVKTTAAPPYMLGAGGYVSTEIYPGITASLFGSLHITERYRYTMELSRDDAPIYETAEFEGRMIIGNGGLLLSWEVDLEDVDIMPYVGLENSLHRSNSIIKKLCPTRGCQVDELDPSGNYAITMNEDEFLYPLAGITLRRPNGTTMRIEGHVSRADWTLSGGLGIKF